MTMPTQPQPTLEEGLRELHLQLGQQLQSGFSGSDAEQVLLDVGASYARLVEQYVSVPQYNTPGETVRAHVVDVYTQLAKLLGRNSKEAVKADAKNRIKSNAESITSYNRRTHGSIDKWIELVAKDFLDKDMEEFAGAIEMYSHRDDKTISDISKQKLVRAYNTMASKRRLGQNTNSNNEQCIGEIKCGNIPLSAKSKKRNASI